MKKTVKRFQGFLIVSFFLSGFVFIGCVSTPKAPPYWTNGVWVGKGAQKNTGQTWSMIYVGSNKSKKYMVYYPTLKCGGYLDFKGLRKSSAVFRERITIGKTRCVNGGTYIVARKNASTLVFMYSNPGSKKLDALAILVKSKKSGKQLGAPALD